MHMQIDNPIGWNGYSRGLNGMAALPNAQCDTAGMKTAPKICPSISC